MDLATTIRRHALGILGLMLLIGGIFFAFGWSAPSSTQSASGSMIKIGLVLGALWLAWPQVDRFLAKTPAWLLATSLIGIILIVVRPITALIVLPCLALLWLFGPRLATQADQMLFSGKRKKSNRRR